jgi:hypothetical protein
VSPLNPDLLLAAAQTGDGLNLAAPRNATTVLSRDGGRTWHVVNLPNPAPTPFDVMTAGAPDGRLYLMMGVIGGAFAAQIMKDAPPKSLIRFWSSADQGFTWDGPTELASSVDPDHMRMVIDQSAAKTRGRVYVAWNDVADQFVQNQYEIFLQWSDDHGKTFNQPKLIATGTDGKLVATEPVVLADGTLLVTYYQYFNPLARRENERMPMYVARSVDGAKTFSPPEQIFSFGPHVWRDRTAEFARAFSLPIVTADTSSTSPNRDHIYITWDDVSGGSSNIWFVRSIDKGRTWSRPIKVNDNGPAPPNGIKDYRMTPVVAVNPVGTIMIAWYDRRNDPNRMCWEYLGAISTDGGTSFGSNFKISTAPSCPPAGFPPAAVVHNVSPRLPDPDRLPDSLLEKRGTIERLMIRITTENEDAKAEANRDLTTSRLTLSFDPARNVWPGHYTGLAADRNGAFHAVWLDRRSGGQELYTARVVTGSEPSTDLIEADLTTRTAVIAGAPVFDATKNTVTLALQIRNVGGTIIGGPLRLAIQGIGAAAPFDTSVSFTGKLGTADRLWPRDISEPVKITFQVKPESGYDAKFDFRITGFAPRAR